MAKKHTLGEKIFGMKINKTRVVPVTLKIVFTFTILILASNFFTNYINLAYNKALLIKQMKVVLAKDLKDIFDFANNQYEIYQFNYDLDSSIEAIENKAFSSLKEDKTKSIALGVYPSGEFMFEATMMEDEGKLTSSDAIEKLYKVYADYTNGVVETAEGFMNFEFKDMQYFIVYKYAPKWDVFLIRGEEYNEFYAETWEIYKKVAIIIIIITIILFIAGTMVLRHLLKYVRNFTNSIIGMIENQSLETIDISNAPNDDITFLGAAFNSLSGTIDNLVSIFRKFATRDVAERAYKERIIRLEGTQKELTILFSDIKGFTFITETLGADIIKLLNMHYDKAIRVIIENYGIIGSIIGDALLAVYGTNSNTLSNKSFLAIQSGYKLQEVASWVRREMAQIRELITIQKGELTPEEEKVYKAVQLEIGVGIDGGTVFYGNIGSNERMTNTVIGDNVNAASRLEGLTRVYKVPVICSDYVKQDVEKNVKKHGIIFVEIDQVQVKGKTIGKRVYWPILSENFDEQMRENIESFSKGLELYYEGKWTSAYKYFEECNISLAEVFKQRTKTGVCPPNWKGIWTMKTK